MITNSTVTNITPNSINQTHPGAILRNLLNADEAPEVKLLNKLSAALNGAKIRSITLWTNLIIPSPIVPPNLYIQPDTWFQSQVKNCHS
jgi:hypothetical protein